MDPALLGCLFEKPADMGSPEVQSYAALGEKLMTLVDCCNSRDRASLMVKNLVGNMWRNAQPGHP